MPREVQMEAWLAEFPRDIGESLNDFVPVRFSD